MENRLFYLDRLKVFLTVLVVLHHTSIIYGGAGSWYYYEPQDSIVAQAILSTFTAVNQSFFMGLFFSFPVMSPQLPSTDEGAWAS